jgi:pimeloyl-ACP methyl ester carboxylesterase
MRIAPERVAAIALVDTNALPDTNEQAASRRSVNEAIRNGSAATGGGSLDYLIHPAADETVRRELTDMGLRVGRDVYVRQNEAVLAREDLRGVLATIAVPCFVIVGEQDRMTPLALSVVIHEGIEGSELCVIPDCGHLPPIEKPDVVAGLLRGLLARATALQG